jgi:ribosome maturation factor RimP
MSGPDLQTTIEQRLATSHPDVEVLLAESVSGGVVRLFIDRQNGVDLALCESVTNELRDLLTEYSLEVSSPGPERPLTKPDHFRRFVGRRARVRTREEHGSCGHHAPRACARARSMVAARASRGRS